MHRDFFTILDAVTITVPARYALQGEWRAPAMGDEEALVAFLEDDLYRNLYVVPAPRTALPPGAGPGRRDLACALSAANTGRGTWEPGWTIGATDEDGPIAVAKDGLTFWVAPTGLKVAGGAIQPGARCRVRVGKELRNLLPGYYLAIGDGEGDEDDARGPLARYYWHLKPTGPVPFVAAATALLNATGVPFRLKVINDPNAYLRADAGVLYLDRCYVDRARTAIAQLYEMIHDELRPDVPLFTKRLADGLGLAEDPADGSSFGQHRCRLAARALWRSFVRGETDPVARAATMAETVRAAGLDPARPYLQPGSPDGYALGNTENPL